MTGLEVDLRAFKTWRCCSSSVSCSDPLIVSSLWSYIILVHQEHHVQFQWFRCDKYSVFSTIIYWFRFVIITSSSKMGSSTSSRMISWALHHVSLPSHFIYLLFITFLSHHGCQGSPFDSLTTSAMHRGCPESYKKFEIMSGFAFNSPSDAFASLPVSLAAWSDNIFLTHIQSRFMPYFTLLTRLIMGFLFDCVGVFNTDKNDDVSLTFSSFPWDFHLWETLCLCKKNKKKKITDRNIRSAYKLLNFVKMSPFSCIIVSFCSWSLPVYISFIFMQLHIHLSPRMTDSCQMRNFPRLVVSTHLFDTWTDSLSPKKTSDEWEINQRGRQARKAVVNKWRSRQLLIISHDLLLSVIKSFPRTPFQWSKLPPDFA